MEGHVSLSHAVPCLSSWGEDEITEREKRERELGGYGCGEVLFSFVMFDTANIIYMGLSYFLVLCRWFVRRGAIIWSLVSTKANKIDHQHAIYAIVLSMILSLNKRRTR